MLVETNEYAGLAVEQGVIPLDSCRVRTLYLLNLRDAPDGAVMGQVPYDITLEAIQRTSGWINVIFEDRNGWLTADLVATLGDCGD